jgi:hypothetical protein
MKKNLILAALMASTSILLSCGGGGSEGRAMKFEIGEDRVINLKNANAYITYSWVHYAGASRSEGEPTHKARAYAITDGTRNNSDAYYSIEGYTNATYLITFELFVPNSSDFEDGDYPIKTDFGSLASNERGASFYFEDSDGNYAEVTMHDWDDLELTGDLDGTFAIYAFVSSMEYTLVVDHPVDAEIYFKGTFENVIFTP